MTLRTVTVVVYVLLVPVVGYLRKAPSSSSGWCAIAPIVQNTRLTEDHLEYRRGGTPLDAWAAVAPSTFLGRYALQDVNAGTCLTAEMVGRLPTIRHEPNRVVVPIGASDPGAGLNAQAKIYVCDASDGSCLDKQLTVKAVAGKGESFSVLVLVDEAGATAIRKLKKPQVRIAVLSP
jgi:hypothetical protein